MDLHPGEQLLYQGRPSPLSSIGFFLRWGSLALVPGVVASVVAGLGGETGLPVYQWWLISVLLVLLVVVRDAIRRVSVRYTVTTERIHIRRGLLSRSEHSTDIDRVQNVNTSQSFLERALNVGDVDFDTAGTNVADSDFSFSGVGNPRGIVQHVQGYMIQRERQREGL
ncbi:MAG TPA: PH domain-containing protein [Miltoncostaeaceae bacterium]|jgi:uncharacterized membrane protein YdbT with pleckstrin-like domain|nr:PH domain-containing protein [Miltoncostaeaceae bacterium]